MKKIILLILSLLFCLTSYAFEPPKQIVFFGDSLSDNGNLYYVLKKPKSPPYYQGRFSNGPTWADNLGEYYSKKYGTTYLNYAVGGATVIFRNPFKGYLPYCFRQEINRYLRKAKPEDISTAMYVIWFGANDYLNGQDDVEKSTTQVINKIRSNIELLISKGAKNFVIINLPDLAKTPYARTVTYKDNLRELSERHNQKLAVEVAKLTAEHRNATFYHVNIYIAVNDLIKNPEKFNQKYGTHIKNTFDQCWTGGYTINKEDKLKLSDELKQSFTEQGVDTKNMDTLSMSEELLNSPSIAEAYSVAKAYEHGVVPCDKPDEYLFWDHVHPTMVAHQIVTAFVLEDLINRKG